MSKYKKKEQIVENVNYSYVKDDLYVPSEVVAYIDEALEDIEEALDDASTSYKAVNFFQQIKPTLTDYKQQVTSEKKVSDETYRRVENLVEAVFKWTRD